MPAAMWSFDMAVEQPRPAVVGLRVGDHHAAGQQLGHVGPHPHHRRGVAVPVRSVKVDFGAQ
jgi:hypothetical protein